MCRAERSEDRTQGTASVTGAHQTLLHTALSREILILQGRQPDCVEQCVPGCTNALPAGQVYMILLKLRITSVPVCSPADQQATEFNYWPELWATMRDLYKAFSESAMGMRASGAAAVNLCHVAPSLNNI